MRVVLVLTLAGCLSEPAPPHGEGAQIAPNSILRQDLAVGDLDGDGFDDIVTWGNEGGPGIAPTVFVYWGGESLENPDVRLDQTVDDQTVGVPPVAWYEVLGGSISISSDGSDRSITTLTGQDAAPEPPDQRVATRYVYMHSFPATHHAIGAGSTSGGRDLGIGGYADAPGPVFAVAHDPIMTPPLKELVAGNDIVFTYAAPLTPDSPGSQEGAWGALPDTDPADAADGNTQNVFVLPPSGPDSGEPLLLVTDRHAYTVSGDGPVFPLDTPGASLSPNTSSGTHRVVRAASVGDHFYAAGTNELSAGDLVFVDVPLGGQPAAYFGQDASGQTPTDLTIGDVDGNASPDLVTLEGEGLSVYEDLGFDNGDPDNTTFTLISSRTELAGYGIIAIGNFQGDARREIYVFSNTDPGANPPRCFRLVGNALDPCDDE